MSVSERNEFMSNGLISAPVKTLWFEFLLRPDLLDTHLNNADADPSAYDLMIQFLANANNSILSTSTTPTAATTASPTAPSICNGNDDNNVMQQQTLCKKEENDNKKTVAMKHLALKVAAFLKFDIDLIETHLPVNIQYILLNELMRFCERFNAPTSCRLFACILHYRWILRYIMKSNYPPKGSKGLAVPFNLQQQIDPCFVSPEALDILIKKVQDQYVVAVNDLEKLILENKKGNNVEISLPAYSCFKSTSLFVDSNGFTFDWSQCVVLDTSHVLDDILYDVGRWHFFHEDYGKANFYFELINLSKRDVFKQLNGYLTSTRELMNDSQSADEDMEVIDLDQQVNQCVNKILNDETCDISFLDLTDAAEISSVLQSAYKNYKNEKQRITIKKLSKYFANRLKGLRDHLDRVVFDKEEIKRDEKKQESGSISNDAEMFEEGEIVTDEEVSKDPELMLLDATDPEIIQSLASKIQKHPMMINNKWILSPIQSKLLNNIPKSQYDKCHIILAKANQLRNAKLFIESRTLYLSLMEDVQASLPLLADAIKWELLRTDLEHHFDSNDVDERRIGEMIIKCSRALSALDKNTILEFPELTELCCIFLLESRSSSLKEFFNSSIRIIKFSSCLSRLAFEPNSSANVAKEFWELLLPVFVNKSIVSKKQKQQQRTPLFSTSFESFVCKFKDITLISLILSCLSKIHNLLRDNPSSELTIQAQYCSLWPSSLGSFSASLDANAITYNLNLLLDTFLKIRPNELIWLKCKAELSLIDGHYADALKHFTMIIMISTNYFTSFSCNYIEEDPIVHKMIQCCIKLGCHTQAATLHQITREPNYALAFKALSERNCNDSCDDLYECIWDVTFLEYLINLHSRRGEIERKTHVIQLIGQLELNANNSENVLREAADVRRGKLLRIFARTYL